MPETPKHSILKRLLNKPSALVSICIITATIIISLCAYVLAPDASPNANRMVIELGARQPGFKKQLLRIPKYQQEKSSGMQWCSGKPDPYKYVPLNGYYFKGNQLVIRHYIDDHLEDTLAYPIADIAQGVSADIEEQKKYVVAHSIITQTFYLGTDRYGRDILSRLLLGSRVSIAVGLIAVLLSLSIGVLLGSLAGYFGGWVDNAVMFVVNIFWSIPTLLLVFAITLTIGKGFWEIFIAIGLTMWVSAARLIRGQVLVLREMEYVTAARAIGAGHIRIIARHILPNIAGPIMVIAAGNFATAILIEAGLSFLGIGIQPPQPSWGLMIKEHYNFLLTNQPLLAIIPGVAIMLLVYAFNVLGNALRDLLDVRG